MDDVFRAPADPTRRSLLDALFSEDGKTLSALEARFGLSRFGVTKHLGILEGAGLIVTKRRGQEKLHFLNPVPIRLVHDRWVSKFAEPSVTALSELRATLERSMEKVFEIYIRTTPAGLWEAITDSEIRSKFQFGLKITSDWTSGGRYELASPGAPALLGEGPNLEIDPPRRLVQPVVALWGEDVKSEGTSRITWEIEPVGDSCRLLVTDDQMREGANEQICGGWPMMILSGLKTWLETGEVPTTPGSRVEFPRDPHPCPIVLLGSGPRNVSYIQKLFQSWYSCCVPNDLLTLDEVAHELSVSRRRVQAMVHAGQLPAQQVGHQWVVPVSALRTATHLLDRSPGRPLSAKNAWRLIEELGQGALRPGSMDELDSLRRRLRQRGQHRDVYIHSSGLAELRELPEGVLGGRAAAIEVGAPLDDDGVVDLYIRELDYEFFVEPWGPEATDEGGNLQLHIIEPSAWPFAASDRFVPAWVAWLDLEDRRDRAADSLLDRLIGGRLIA